MFQPSSLFAIQIPMNMTDANISLNSKVVGPAELNVREPRLVLLAISLGMFMYFARNGFKSYNHRQFWNSHTLLMHVLSALSEFLLYYVQRYYRDTFHPLKAGKAAVLLCIIQSATNLQMVKYLRKGHPYIVRPTYQAGAFLRPITMLLAYFSESSTLYTDAMMPLHAFHMARAFFFLFGTIGMDSRFKDNVNEEEIYTLAIFGSAVIAVGMSENQYAVTIYLGVVWTLGILNKWTRGQLDRDEDLNLQTSGFVKMLKTIGLCNFKSSSSALRKRVRINKGPLIGDLKGDNWAGPMTRFGHYHQNNKEI